MEKRNEPDRVETSWQLNANTPKRLLGVFGAFVVFFLALFAQFPLQNALPGNCDTLVAIAISNTYLAKITAFIHSTTSGMAMFPAGTVPYGEQAPLLASIFVAFKALGFNDVVAYYFFVTLIFAMTAFAVFVFSGLFLRSFAARMFSAFAVSCSNLMFTHIDDAPVWCYFFPLLALYFFSRAITERSSKLATMAALLGGAQIYFSMYIFAYQTIFLMAMALYYGAWRKERLPWPVLTRNTLLYAGLAAPQFLIYVWALLNLSLASPWDSHMLVRGLSLHLSDMWLPLSNNLLYGHDLQQSWYKTHHQNLIGFFVIFAAGFALFRRGEHRTLLAGMGLLGLLLALGPDLMTGNYENPEPAYPLPLYPLYEWIPLFHFLRVPVRAYFFVLLALSILAGVTLEFLLEKYRKPGAMALVLVIFFGVTFVENVPFPFRAYKMGPYLEASSEYKSFMADKSETLVLDLPSNFGFAFPNWDYELFSDPASYVYADANQAKLLTADVTLMDFSHEDIFAYNRDMLYMNWQTQHRQNIVGGVNGYFPTSRMIYQRWLEDLPAEHVLLWLRKQGVDYIAYHKEMEIPGDREVLNGLETSPLLRQVVHGERSQIFEFVIPEGELAP